MNDWIKAYLGAHRAALDSIPLVAISRLVDMFQKALKEERQIFVFGNGGSATNASHFATDLGKGASDKIGKRFRIISLNDNVAWMLALANDYAFDEVFVGQLKNYGKPGDIAFGISVSGNSPNCVKAMEWAKQNGLYNIALVGSKRGRMAELSDQSIIVDDTHYGRVEDVQMTICHMLCYAFMERPELGKG